MLLVSSVGGSGQAAIDSVHAAQDVPLGLDPNSDFWRASRPVYMEKDSFGKIVPRYRTEVRTRWTNKNLYFLFVCPYQELHLKPAPSTDKETDELWNWDVAEVFIGSDFANIKRYKEFEISPQGEWGRSGYRSKQTTPRRRVGVEFRFRSNARIDESQHTWYGAMRIPWAAIDARPPHCREHAAHQLVSEPGSASASASHNLATSHEGIFSRS